MKILALKGKVDFQFKKVKGDIEKGKKIIKEDTKECKYCEKSYLLKFIHQHENHCKWKPETKQTYEIDPII